MNAKLRSWKQPFYYAHGFCGLEIPDKVQWEWLVSPLNDRESVCLGLDSYEGIFTSMSGSWCWPSSWTSAVLLTRTHMCGFSKWPRLSNGMATSGKLHILHELPGIQKWVSQWTRQNLYYIFEQPQKSQSLHSITFYWLQVSHKPA